MKRHPSGSCNAWFSLALLLVLALAAAGCTGTEETTTPVPPTPPIAGPTGVLADTATPQPAATTPTQVATTAAAVIGQKQSIRVSGSTTVLPIAQKAAEAYMASHPDADIQVSGGGSGVGIQQLGEKTVDIGMSSRELSATETTTYPSLVRHVVARDGIAIIVNTANEITVISAENVKDIYTGQITKWSQIPGGNVPNTNQQIVVVGRDSASGTREFFDKAPGGILKGTAPARMMIEKNSNGAVIQTVAQTPGAIGYVSIGFITPDVKALPIWYNDPDEAIAPTSENVISETYPINRELFMFTNGRPTGIAADFLAFVKSPAGQEIAAGEGYIPLV